MVGFGQWFGLGAKILGRLGSVTRVQLCFKAFNCHLCSFRFKTTTFSVFIEKS